MTSSSVILGSDACDARRLHSFDELSPSSVEYAVRSTHEMIGLFRTLSKSLAELSPSSVEYADRPFHEMIGLFGTLNKSFDELLPSSVEYAFQAFREVDRSRKYNKSSKA